MGATGRILVTGATGQVGRGVVDDLVAAGAAVRAGCRNPGRLATAGNIEAVRVDLTDPETLPAALDGVSKVFLYAAPEGVAGFVDAARSAGVEHVVVLSSHTVAEVIPDRKPIAEMHQVVEKAIVDSGIPYTFLRPDNFATNVLMWGWADSIRTEGVARFPYPESHSDAIHERDIAAVAATTLTEPGHTGKSYVITGPDSVTQRQQAELISEAIGKPITVEELTPEQARIALSELIPAWVMDATVGFWAATDGIPVPVTDTVEKITGRPARSFGQWAIDHAKDFM